ncbi:MAG: DinB family protein [Candidatus Acidiferrum sp.]
MHSSHAALAEIRDSLLETYASNDAMNQLILARLDARAWRAKPPGEKGKGRTIAALFAHLHNTRRSWLRNSAPHLKCPARLDPRRCTMKEAAAAHKKSAALCLRMLSNALSAGPNRRVTKFVRDGYVPTWPAGGTMFAYMFSHEAHHRGQILMLAHQLGYRVAEPNVWQWEKMWKQAGLKTRPR